VAAALILTPIVLAGATLSRLDLGAPEPAPSAPAPMRAEPRFDVPVDVEVFEDNPTRLRIETNEEALRPRCDPVRAIRDGFRPKHQRCRAEVPGV
jgi:hypothetical protein